MTPIFDADVANAVVNLLNMHIADQKLRLRRRSNDLNALAFFIRRIEQSLHCASARERTSFLLKRSLHLSKDLRFLERSFQAVDHEHSDPVVLETKMSVVRIAIRFLNVKLERHQARQRQELVRLGLARPYRVRKRRYRIRVDRMDQKEPQQ